MQRNLVYKICLLIFSLTIVFSFLLPIVNIVWRVPGEDVYGNPIVVDIDHYYSIIKMFSQPTNWFPIFIPILYLVSILTYAVLYFLKSLNKEVSNKVLQITLIFPMLVSLYGLLNFTWLGLMVFVSQIACFIILGDKSSVFFIFNKTR